jgi:hypothetical protein
METEHLPGVSAAPSAVVFVHRLHAASFAQQREDHKQICTTEAYIAITKHVHGGGEARTLLRSSGGGGLRSAGDRAAATKKPWMIQSTKCEIRYPRVQYDAPFAIRGTGNSDMQGSAQAGARAKWVLVDDSTIGNAFGKANASILKKHTNFKRKLGERACQMQSSQHAGRWQDDNAEAWAKHARMWPSPLSPAKPPRKFKVHV